MEQFDIAPGLFLKSLEGGLLELAPEEMAPATVMIHEWRQYSIECPGSWALPRLVSGALPSQLTTSNSLIFQFENQLGLTRIEMSFRGRIHTLILEVIASKFQSVSTHADFFHQLTSELHAKAPNLPYALESPTSTRTKTSLRQPSDLLVWHFLKRNDAALRNAVEAITHHVRRELRDGERSTGIHEIGRFAPRMLEAFLGVLGPMTQVQPDSSAAKWAVSQQIQRITGSKILLPERLYELVPEEVYDTQENRFVKSFLIELIRSTERLRARFSGSAPTTWLANLGTFIARELEGGFWDMVGESTFFPHGSRLLQRAPGYRELYALWLEFNSALDPFWSLDSALAVRDVAVLYEWWCFFALVGRLETITGETAQGVLTNDGGDGLRHNVTAKLGRQIRVAYNREFSRPSMSYSLRLRPDFILLLDEQPLIAFDAKFRFDIYELDTMVDQVLDEPATASKALERFAKNSDVYKMHTYRDALHLRAAVVLFPGTSDRVDFYRIDGNKLSLHLAELITSDCPEGVGTLSLIPQASNL